MGDPALTPGLGRSPGERKGYPLQYSGLEKSMDSIAHAVTESDITEQLSLSLLLGRATWFSEYYSPSAISFHIGSFKKL